jgi:L-ascorbate metabolism protein UlaG (beta-lactamase superfamily)
MTRRLLAAIATVLAASSCSTPNLYYDANKPHHTPQGFRNTDANAVAPRPFGDFLRWQRERWSLDIPPPKVDLSPIVPDLGYIQKNRSDFAVTWVGHATVLVQIGGLNILTDPQFSERAFPVQWMGPKRWQPPALRLEELPHIDVVVVSHNHYDHLDYASVKALAAQAGGSPLFVVPLGNERWLAEQGISNARALDWWDVVEVKGTKVHLVPVQHWSRRTLTDANQCLWGGFVLEGSNKGRLRKVFFGGDTGYSSADFKAIGARFGSIDLGLIPIGAYAPRWFMGVQHVDPDEAVKIHQDIRARRSLGIHWGTFQLTDEPLDQAPVDLAAARQKHGLASSDFFTVKHGETRRLDSLQ